METAVKKRIIILIAMFSLLTLVAALSATAEEPPLLSAKVLHSQVAYAQGGAYPLAIALTIRPGWHINSDRPKEKDLYPTTMLLQCSRDCSFSPAVFPKATNHKPDFSKTALDVFGGTVIVRTTLTVAKDAQLGPQLLGARLSYQGCDDQACAMPDDLEVPIQVKIVPTGQSTAPLNQEIFKKK